MAGTITNKRIVNINYCPESIDGVEILEKIETGGSEAAVYIGEKNGERFLVKIYNSALSSEMERILTTVQNINNPSIAKIISFGEKEGHAYEIQEYYENSDIKSSIPYLCSHILPRLNNAINTLNLNNIIHLDLKPENIVISGRNVKIIDFGVSCFAGENTLGFSLEYAAPEVVMGKAVNAKADYYSLGITLFELLAGYNPFKGLTKQKNELLKSDPDSWISLSMFGDSLTLLIRSLVAPNASLRWGYSEVIDWLDSESSLAASEDIKRLLADNETYTVDKLYLNNNAYSANQIGDYINDCIFNGKEGCKHLFDNKQINLYKSMDPHLSFLVSKYQSMAASDIEKAAVNVKVEYGYDEKIVIPGLMWDSLWDAGRALIMRAVWIYDNIVIKTEMKCYHNLSKNEKPQVFTSEKYPEWYLLSNGLLSIYSKNQPYADAIGLEEREFISKLPSLKKHCYGKDLLLMSDENALRSSSFPYSLNNYYLLYHMAKIGYIITELDALSFMGQLYNTIDDLYDKIIELMNNPDPNEMMSFIYYLRRYDDGNSTSETIDGNDEANVYLQPVLQALIDARGRR